MTTTIDINTEAGLALVGERDGVTYNNVKYVPISEAPPLDNAIAKGIPRVYMKQYHYVAGHKPSGLTISVRLFNGKPAPKTGWEIYK